MRARFRRTLAGSPPTSWSSTVLSTVVHQRQSYRRTAISGLMVLDVRSEREAAAEVRSLYAEVRALLPSTIDA